MCTHKKYSLFLFFVFVTHFSFSQPKFSDRIYTGGTLGLQFGNYTVINISPLVGYRFTDKFSAGPGITYIYLSDSKANLSTSIYGGRIFARYSLLENVFAHAEYEVFNVEGSSGKRVNLDGLLAGGGYTQPLGGRAVMNFIVLYNLLGTNLPFESNPIIRIGVGLGL